ncbi:MAG TPA: NAD+ synthase [candidate division Zixibacteria bacterium]|nr:NAD+ synthase [candidate division Zixibacteria bacterium]HEQ98367.1 NAD+ synthase [candidate division Zixibacteria bacterium]
MKRKFRIALAQINSTVGALDQNLDKIISYARRAEEHGCDIVAYPELALTGYPPEDLLLKKAFNLDVSRTLKKLIKEKIRPIMVFGYPDFDGGKYNSAAVIYNNKLVASVNKFMLPNYGVFDEKRYFTPGNGTYIFDLGFMRFGVNICEDIWVTPGTTEILTLHGANLVINISASPYTIRKEKYRETMIQRIVKRCHMFLAFCNMVGGQDELVFDGYSMIFNPEGEMLASAKTFEEDMIFAEIDPLESEAKRFTITVPRQIPPVEIKRLGDFKNRKRTKAIKSVINPPPSREEEIYKALILGTTDYIQKNGFSEVVVGLSGGIDSAVTAVLAYDCVGPERMHLVFMPSEYTQDQSTKDAKKLAQNLGIPLQTFPIDSTFQCYKEMLKGSFKGLKEDITEENLQARIRGNILMALSNKFKWLVLTTGNKSEVSVGYSTLYGDTAGGFAVIKDLYKTEVFKLARYYNRKEKRTVIPRSVIEKPPSAELRHNQKDTDSLPPYEVLDPILKLYIEQDRGQKEIIDRGYDEELVNRIIRMVDLAEYKRRQSPPGVKITPKAFGRDRRMPITQRYFR